MTLSVRVSSSSTTTFIIFFCYGKEQIDDNQSLKLKETVTVICSKTTEPTAWRHSHCSFFFLFSVRWPWLHIFQFQFSFWNHMLLEKKVMQQTWFSDRGYFLIGVAQKTCWFGNCKMSTTVSQAYFSQGFSHW